MPRRLAIFLVGLGVGTVLLMLFFPRQDGRERWRDSVPTAPHGHYPVTQTDAYGRPVELARQPRRLVSLAPSVTETLFAMGAGSLVIGRSEFCQYPPEAAAVPSVGGMNPASVENILTRSPQLVLGSTLTARESYDRLTAIRIPSFALAQANWDGVLADVATLGRLLALDVEAAKLIRELRQRRSAVEECLRPLRGSGQAPRRVLLLYDVEGRYSAARGSWVHDLLEACHAVNVAGDGGGSAWPQLSLEGIVAAQPEVLLITRGRSPAEQRMVAKQVAGLPEHAIWRTVPAVVTGRVHLVESDPLAVPGPRMINALEALAAAIWPEVHPPPKPDATTP